MEEDFYYSSPTFFNDSATFFGDVNAFSNISVGGDITGASNISVSGNITGKTVSVSSGRSNQFLKADGTLDSNTYLTTAPAAEFSSGTTLLFYQATAPTGYTKQTTHDNKAMRVVSGTGGGSGGTTNFTSVFASRAVPLPQHAHSGSTGTVSSDHAHGFQNFYFAEVDGNSGLPNAYAGSNSGSDFDNVPWYTDWTTGGINANHTHSFTTNNEGTAGAAMDFAVQYIDVIICSKN
jgi:hypothetical protein